MLGAFAVGKTSLVRRFVEGRFDDRYLSTIGVKISRRTILLPDSPQVNLLIWDLAGGDEFNGVLSSYLQGASGALLVCDLTRTNTLDLVEFYARRVRELNTHVSITIVGNKDDLIDQREIQAEQIGKMAEKLGGNWFITSAKVGAGVEEAFRAIAERIVGG
jgi:small GTP-binding protein